MKKKKKEDEKIDILFLFTLLRNLSICGFFLAIDDHWNEANSCWVEKGGLVNSDYNNSTAQIFLKTKMSQSRKQNNNKQ